MLSNRFTTSFSQNAAVKKILKIGQYLANISTKLCGLLFSMPPCTHRLNRSLMRVKSTLLPPS